MAFENPLVLGNLLRDPTKQQISSFANQVIVHLVFVWQESNQLMIVWCINIWGGNAFTLCFNAQSTQLSRCICIQLFMYKLIYSSSLPLCLDWACRTFSLKFRNWSICTSRENKPLLLVSIPTTVVFLADDPDDAKLTPWEKSGSIDFKKGSKSP